MNVNTILDRLDHVKKSGADQWMAVCPSHADDDPSLAIKATDDGRILLHCFAGCGACDVVSAIGLTMSDLFPDGKTGEWYSFGYRKTPPQDPHSKDRLIMLFAACDSANGRQLNRKDLTARDVSFRRLHAAGKAMAVMDEVKIIKSGGSVPYGKNATIGKEGIRSVK